MSKKVKVHLGKDGSVRVEAEGFKGADCEKATEFLDRIFGSPENRKYKDSFYEEGEALVEGLPEGHCG